MERKRKCKWIFWMHIIVIIIIIFIITISIAEVGLQFCNMNINDNGEIDMEVYPFRFCIKLYKGKNYDDHDADGDAHWCGVPTRNVTWNEGHVHTYILFRISRHSLLLLGCMKRKGTTREEGMKEVLPWPSFHAWMSSDMIRWLNWV